MYKFLQLSFIAFCIVCTTACPQPTYTEMITGNQTVGKREMKGLGYKVYFNNIHHLRYNGQKIIFFDMEVSNSSSDTLTMSCSGSVIYSNTDTFSWQKPDERFKRYYFYDDIKDTLTLAPDGNLKVNMLLVGKNNYSRRLYTKSNKKKYLIP